MQKWYQHAQTLLWSYRVISLWIKAICMGEKEVKNGWINYRKWVIDIWNNPDCFISLKLDDLYFMMVFTKWLNISLWIKYVLNSNDMDYSNHSNDRNKTWIKPALWPLYLLKRMNISWVNHHFWVRIKFNLMMMIG